MNEDYFAGKMHRRAVLQFWLHGEAAFADPEVYKYCEGERVTYFIRLPSNENLKKLSWPALRRPAGRHPQSGVKVNLLDFRYQAKSWNKPRRVFCKVEWHRGELFPRVGYIVTNSTLSSREVVKTYNGRG